MFIRGTAVRQFPWSRKSLYVIGRTASIRLSNAASILHHEATYDTRSASAIACTSDNELSRLLHTVSQKSRHSSLVRMFAVYTVVIKEPIPHGHLKRFAKLSFFNYYFVENRSRCRQKYACIMSFFFDSPCM